MNTQDLIAGYTAYTDVQEIGQAVDDAPAAAEAMTTLPYTTTASPTTAPLPTLTIQVGC